VTLAPWQPTLYGNERQRPRFPERITPALAQFIGLWLGDGHFYVNEAGHQYELGWTQQEPERREMFIGLLDQLFGVQARVSQPPGHAAQVLVGCRALVTWLQEVVGLKGGAVNKSIPTCVLRSTRESMRSCLEGLWQTDGTIREQGGSNWAMFATCSETLARQVHTLLIAFGIVSSLKRTPNNWEVRVYGQNVNLLIELLPSLRQRFTVGAEAQATPLPNVDVLPFLKPRLRGLYQRATNREELKRRFSGNLHDKNKPNVSYRFLEEFLRDVRTDDPEAQKEIAGLRHLLEQRHVWLPVERIETAEQGRVYDVSVVGTHAYWANGFISHNCFNFDGELNIANRGLVEFIEVLKLDVAFLYDLLGASQEHKIKPKKFAQTDIDEVILGHSVTGAAPIPYRRDGVPGWLTLAQLYERFVDDVSGLEVLAYDFERRQATWTPVRSLFRHRFTGNLLTTSQKWGVVETTPNHSIYDRDGAMFYPEEQREVMAVRALSEQFAAVAPVEVIDLIEGEAGFVRDQVRVTSRGGKMTRPCREGWARLNLPRHATAVRAVYDPICDVEPLKDLLTVLVWYATEGHVNGRNGGIVITQANRDELERVRAAYARITTRKGSIDAGAKTDSAWRLYLGSQAIARVAQRHCGEHAVNKRLPDFLFRLPTAYLQHAFDELMCTDGSRRLTSVLEQTASADYRERFFEFKTIWRRCSAMITASIGRNGLAAIRRTAFVSAPVTANAAAGITHAKRA
jgi:hypothetical protein